jgi:large subunit ribosomal protein L18
LNLFIQAIDDFAERTVFSASTLAPALKSMGRKQWGNVESATLFGNFVAEELKKKQIIKIVFDRRGNAYHGRIQAFAEALRKGGIQF